jgi:hypothetical protein
VVAHAERLHILDPQFKVSEAGRQRVLKEQRKNVHAYVVADYDSIKFDTPTDGKGWIDVTYNPYRSNTFTRKDSGRAIFHASEALLYVDSNDKAHIVVI